MNFGAATQYLAAFINYEKNLNALSVKELHLERVNFVLAKIGSPHLYLKVIHIAGSKGKGSTAAFIANILKEAGYRVGLYTSPHLYDVRERIRILFSDRKIKEKGLFDDCIPAKDLAALLTQLKPVIEKYERSPTFGHLTYFEVLTILAFLYFKKEKVNLAVLETGLGGRLDATNVGHPLVCAITPISLEHTAILGKTVTKIAKEKAGIIKKTKGAPAPIVISASQTKEADKVLRARCRAVGADLRFVRKDIKARFISAASSGQVFSVGRKVFKTSLLGRHQIDNAAVAVGVVEALRRRDFLISENAVIQGIARTTWPLRFEIVKRKPIVILDAAHNPESCRRLADTIREIFSGRKAVFVLGCSDDKDIAGMVKALSPAAKSFILTQARHPRAYAWKTSNVKQIFKAQDVKMVQSAREACRQGLKSLGTSDILVVTGSLFAAAEARSFFTSV